MNVAKPQVLGTAGAVVLMVIFGNLAANVAKPVPPSPPNRPSYVSGKQVLFVYIGSEGCKASLTPLFPHVLSAVRESVSVQASRSHEAFSTLGISAGNSVELGVAYLKKFGAFDEVSIGHGWLNDATMHFVWRTLPGQAMVPQVVVVERDLTALQPGYDFSNERVLVRALGVQQIQTWLEDGARIR